MQLDHDSIINENIDNKYAPLGILINPAEEFKNKEAR